MNSATPGELKLGIIGLDTSHAAVFSDMFNNGALKGARVVAAWPGGSPDIKDSVNLLAHFEPEVRDKFGVKILGSIEEVVAVSDGILLHSLDGRAHRPQFERIAPAGKPVFIDKPFATTTADAEAMFALARRHKAPMFSASSLRFTEAITRVITQNGRAAVTGADFSGPAAHEPTNPGLFWYGIHTVEMLYTAMGRGCRSVRCVSTSSHDLVTGVWADGRLGTMRGNRTGNNDFCGLIHCAGRTFPVNVQAEPKGYYASLGEAILAFMRGGPVPIEPAETIEMVRFMEAANESARNGGREVTL
jgi:predicted dehydrogenase